MSSFSCFDSELENVGPTQIFPFLYLGSQKDALNRELMKEHNITYVINLSVNCPRPDFISDDSKFIRFPVNDTSTAKLLPHFEQAFHILEQVRAKNEVALIHCLAGISRSPTMAVAYVMRHRKMNQDEAYRFVKERRPTISPNFNFMSQLFEYEKQLQKLNIITPPPSASVSPISNTNTSNSVSSSDGEECPKTAPATLTPSITKSASVGHVVSNNGSTFRLQRPTRMFDIPSSPGVNEFGKRASDTPYPKHERPKQLIPSVPLQTPSQETKSFGDAKLQRPTRFGSSRQRRSGHLCSADGKELPSPSTEFERLTFSTPQEMSISNPIFAASALQHKSMNKSKFTLTPTSYAADFPTISETCPYAVNPVFQTEVSTPSQCSSNVAEESKPNGTVNLRENYHPSHTLHKPDSLSSSSQESSPFLSPHYSMDTESPESGYAEGSSTFGADRSSSTTTSPNTESAPRRPESPSFESTPPAMSEQTPERNSDRSTADAESLSSSSSLEIVVI
uniref:protein-tyrosine-phosphatase n=1 Tax=Steinernema glaseri TaxID=37863 RepID=A0A1I7Z4L4_9BILA